MFRENQVNIMAADYRTLYDARPSVDMMVVMMENKSLHLMRNDFIFHHMRSNNNNLWGIFYEKFATL